tara:strand:+ start:1249 stop:1686 length:438 start_codon:yes stop_codon:yes gene_type:complete
LDILEFYLLLVELIQPINCILISEEVPTISIILSERRTNGLKGLILNKRKIKGDFYTHKPTKDRSTSWSYEKEDLKLTGGAILFKDHEIWHRYQNRFKSYEVNKVHFYGLASKLSKLTNEKELIKATSGFFKIGNECYGGRINKV